MGVRRFARNRAGAECHWRRCQHEGRLGARLRQLLGLAGEKTMRSEMEDAVALELQGANPFSVPHGTPAGLNGI